MLILYWLKSVALIAWHTFWCCFGHVHSLKVNYCNKGRWTAWILETVSSDLVCSTLCHLTKVTQEAVIVPSLKSSFDVAAITRKRHHFKNKKILNSIFDSRSGRDLLMRAYRFCLLYPFRPCSRPNSLPNLQNLHLEYCQYYSQDAILSTAKNKN